MVLSVCVCVVGQRGRHRKGGGKILDKKTVGCESGGIHLSMALSDWPSDLLGYCIKNEIFCQLDWIYINLRIVFYELGLPQENKSCEKINDGDDPNHFISSTVYLCGIFFTRDFRTQFPSIVSITRLWTSRFIINVD
jgi:hypothetical protein